MMTPQELDQFLAVLKVHGVQAAKIGDVSVQFEPNYREIANVMPSSTPAFDPELQFAHSN
jgi:hypothetical protein